MFRPREIAPWHPAETVPILGDGCTWGAAVAGTPEAFTSFYGLAFPRFPAEWKDEKCQ
jgi:hypothetical protein